jgi:hypothetical protein
MSSSRFSSQLRRPADCSTSRCVVTRRLRASVLALAMALPIARGAAQTLAEQTQPALRRSSSPTRVISVNPFLPLFGFFSGEFEYQFAPSVSFAVAGSHTEPFDATYTNLDAKIRLYPSQTGLRGFNLASSLGVARIRDQSAFCEVLNPVIDVKCDLAKPFSTGSFAVELGYQWLLGPSRVTAVSIGGGAKRYLGSEKKFDGVTRVIPTLRLNVGYAF